MLHKGSSIAYEGGENDIPGQKQKKSFWGRNCNETVMDSEVNICAIMVALYCDTDAADIPKMGLFISLPALKTWDKNSSNHSENVNNQITSIVNTIIEEIFKK